MLRCKMLHILLNSGIYSTETDVSEIVPRATTDKTGL